MSWFESSLGYALMVRLINHLQKMCDIVDFATVICVLGGSKAVCELLRPQDEQKDSSFSNDLMTLLECMERVLHSHADSCARWGASHLATEVYIRS